MTTNENILYFSNSNYIIVVFSNKLIKSKIMNSTGRKEPIKHLSLLIFASLSVINYTGRGYLFALLSLVYILIYKNTFLKFDCKLLFLLFFGFTYVTFYYWNYNSITPNIAIYLLIIFPIFYLAGKGLASNNTDNNEKIIFTLSLSMATIPIISIFLHIADYGFLYPERNIPIFGLGTEPIAATSIASIIIVLTSYSTYILNNNSNKRKYVYFFFGLIGFICVLRLQSRTSIVCIALLFVANIILNWELILRHKFTFIVTIILLTVGISYVMTTYTEQLGVIERFQDDDIATANGRFTRQVAVIEALFESPLGGKKHLAYAHNLFLDCARVSGIVPLLFLLLFTIKHYYSIYNIYKNKTISIDEKYNIITISLLLFVYMNTEPILEGVGMLFAVFCFIAGVTSRIEINNRILQKTHIRTNRQFYVN